MMPRFPLVLPLLLLLAFPVHGAIRSTPERELTARQLDLAASNQDDARIAADGTSFFTIWTELGDILGARLAPNGALIDTTPLQLATTTDEETRPAIAWGRDQYLAVWHSGFNTIRGRFLRTDGTMSDVLDFGTREGRGLPAKLHIAFNGRMFLVLWFEDGDGDTRVYRGAIVDTDGRVSAAREIVRGPIGSENDLAAMGGTFWFAYSVYEPEGFPRTARVVVLPIDESALAGQPRELAPPSALVGSIAAAARDDEFLVAWTTRTLALEVEIRGARVTRGGFEAIEMIHDYGLDLEDVVADRSGYLQLYSEDDGARRLGRRVGSGAPPFAVRPAGRVHDSASNGARSISLIEGLNSLGSDLYANVLGEDIVSPVGLAPRHQEGPDIAAAGELTLAAWPEHLTGEGRAAVLAVRLDQDGNAIDWKPIDTGGSARRQSRPRVASNGTGWLVAWTNGTRIEGARVKRDGSLADATPFLIAGDVFGNEIAVAWDGTSYVVVFTRGHFSRGIHTRIFVARVPASGDPAPPFAVTGIADITLPAIASGPEGSLIVWKDFGALNGAMLSRSDLATPVPFPPGSAGQPAIAWNGDMFLVAAATEFGTRSLRWMRVDAHGNVRESITPIRLQDDGTGYAAIDVEAFRDGFLLYWNDRNFDVRAMVVDRGANLIDGPAVVARTTFGYFTTFGAAGPHVVTSHPIEHPSRFTSRVFAQTIGWTPEATPRRRAVRR